MGIKERLAEPIDYRVGAVLISLVLVVMFVLYRGWAFATGIRWTTYQFLSFLGLESYFTEQASASGFWIAVKFGGYAVAVCLLFFILGSFVAAKISGEFGIKVDKATLPESVIGGLLMGIGMVFISTCNIGTFLNSLCQFSVGAWLTAAGLVVGTYIGAKIYEKRMG